MTAEDRRVRASKAGQARAASMTPERRKEIAEIAIKARWKNNSCKSGESI